ncbi:MAG TPA: hypothetical protein PLC90_06050 [Bacteroidales bacterium]|nr:hypothetical protein [Bacteroidales bacterium]
MKNRKRKIDYEQIKRQLSIFPTIEEEFEIEIFTQKNPWYTEEWFEKNKTKLVDYFECDVTFEAARFGIMEEPDIKSFLEYLEQYL